MATTFDGFETYARRIWNNEDEIPGYAYFCWRWDEKHRQERGTNVYPRSNDPVEDQNFQDDVLESFVDNQEIYYILIEATTDWYERTSPLAVCLWDTYGHLPTRLLHMWRWAMSSDAFSGCEKLFKVECEVPACKVWNYCSEKYGTKSRPLKSHQWYQGTGAKTVAELDPSLTSFGEKLWNDTVNQFMNGDRNELVYYSDSPDGLKGSKFLHSLQSFLYAVYDKLISRTIKDAMNSLQILRTPNVSFLFTDKERAGRHEQRLNEEQNSSQLPPILFAVAGTGKTQFIFDLFATNWGHYLVSGHIGDRPTLQDSILSPRRGGASTDTQWLVEHFKRLKTKRDRQFPTFRYSAAIGTLLDNRQTLMNKWIELNGAQLRQREYWLLFQTTCTPRYDPFRETLKLRMILPYDVGISSIYDQTQFSPAVIDEAQDELDPFWNEQPALTDFIVAISQRQSAYSISGTSLRMKECRDVVCNANSTFTQSQYIENQIDLLVNAFRSLMNPQECQYFAESLANRVLEGYNAAFGEKQLIDFLQEAKLPTILGDFYFTEALRKAKNAEHERTQEILEEEKDSLIPILGTYYKTELQTSYTTYSDNPFTTLANQRRLGLILGKKDLINALRAILTTYHSIKWGCDYNPPDFRFDPDGGTLANLLRRNFMLSSLDYIPKFPFHLVTSEQLFETLLSAHIKRLLEKIGYFCSLGDEINRQEFWRIACPETMVFRSTKDADGRKEFFRQAKALLEKHANATSLTMHQIQYAAENAEREFRQAFVERAQMNEKSDERTCGITKYSVLFRGRMRWSIVYIEHVFASYLKTFNFKPALTNVTSGYINPIFDAGSRLPANPNIPRFMNVEEPIFETATNSSSSNIPFQIQEKAEEAAKYIKSSLKDRIELLKNKGHYLLLRDLYFTAIRADLMHKSSIFPGDKSARMISEGFALLDPAESKYDGSTFAPRQKLSEPIVVDAVIEYLHDKKHNDEENLENVLQSLLFENQDDASSFGKAAEFYFAWSLGGLFSQSSDGLRLSFKARESFREKIGRAKFIPTNNHSCTQVLGNILSYDGYTLEEASPELESDLTLGPIITFSEWLRRVRDGKFFPTFHFPSTFAGPDIVFCLRSPDTKERILCAFQIKTGEKCDKNDSWQLIRTLDPKLWFESAPNLKKDLINELEHWQSHRILTALVITSRSCIDFFASESDFCNGMKDLQHHIKNQELCQTLYQSDTYQELKTVIGKLQDTLLPPNAKSILARAKVLAEEMSQKIPDSIDRNSTEFAKAFINAVEEAMEGPANAAKSIYKTPSQRKIEKAEQNDILMLENEFSCISMQENRRANGYYFVILDDVALKLFLGPTFYHLCKAMKKVETAKGKKRAREEDALESQELICPVAGCRRNRDAYKIRARLNDHIRQKHPGYVLEWAPEAKRLKIDLGAVASGSQVGEYDNDVQMV
ncbi:MAG: hypothetical protein Q9167_006137 [Letrouitia subvulpina]